MTNFPKPKQYWFAAKVEFTCPACKKMSSEVMYLNASKPEVDPIASAVQTQNLKCSACKTQLADGTQVNITVLPVTLEEAKASGFKPPEGATD
jgi:hypothetical protein